MLTRCKNSSVKYTVVSIAFYVLVIFSHTLWCRNAVMATDLTDIRLYSGDPL